MMYNIIILQINSNKTAGDVDVDDDVDDDDHNSISLVSNTADTISLEPEDINADIKSNRINSINVSIVTKDYVKFQIMIKFL